MSPAAQRFATHRLRSGDSALRASYSPSPQRNAGFATPGPSTPLLTPTRRTPVRHTPSKLGKPRTPKITSNLTDDLLQLPSTSNRKRAADFF